MSTTAAHLRRVLAATPRPIGTDPATLLDQFADVARARQAVFAELAGPLPLVDDDDRSTWDEVNARHTAWAEILEAARRDLGGRLSAMRKASAYDVRHDDARFEDFG